MKQLFRLGDKWENKTVVKVNLLDDGLFCIGETQYFELEDEEHHLFNCKFMISPKKPPTGEITCMEDLFSDIPDNPFDVQIPGNKTSKNKKPVEKQSLQQSIEKKSEEKAPEDKLPETKHPDRNRRKKQDDHVCMEFSFKKATAESTGFPGIAGMEALKQTVREQVLLPLRNREMSRKYGVSAINGMLLYGPPGCGKSFFAEKFAEEAGMNYCMVKSSDLSSCYIHGSQQMIQQLFEQAEEHRPCVLCIDEIDAMIPHRGKMLNNLTSGETNEFLTQMNNCSERGIFVIGTSNCPDLIDPAALRSGRFDKKVYVAMPDEEARKSIFELHLATTYRSRNLDYAEMAALTPDFSPADIAAICNEAKLQAMQQQKRVSQQLMKQIIAHSQPSIEEKEVSRNYQPIGAKAARKRIGF